MKTTDEGNSPLTAHRLHHLHHVCTLIVTDFSSQICPLHVCMSTNAAIKAPALPRFSRFERRCTRLLLITTVAFDCPAIFLINMPDANLEF